MLFRKLDKTNQLEKQNNKFELQLSRTFAVVCNPILVISIQLHSVVPISDMPNKPLWCRHCPPNFLPVYWRRLTNQPKKSVLWIKVKMKMLYF